MNVFQALFIVSLSLSLGIVGFFGYLLEVWLGNVDRYTRWKELNLRQWIYFCLSMQFAPVTAILLLARSFA